MSEPGEWTYSQWQEWIASPASRERQAVMKTPTPQAKRIHELEALLDEKCDECAQAERALTIMVNENEQLREQYLATSGVLEARDEERDKWAQAYAKCTEELQAMTRARDLLKDQNRDLNDRYQKLAALLDKEGAK